MNNPVVWFEIAATDLERAKTFYANVFNVNFERVEMPGTVMYMFPYSPEGAGAGGAIVRSDDNSPATVGTTIYFGSADVTTELDRVAGAGGTVILPKMSIGEFGFIALFLDTEGNKIGLHSMA